jgi:hypothetical protein
MLNFKAMGSFRMLDRVMRIYILHAVVNLKICVSFKIKIPKKS